MKKLWEWIDGSGRGAVTDWGLQVRQRARLDQKLEMLRKAEIDSTGRVNLPQDLLAGPGYRGQKWIYKLKVHGNVQLRPMVTLGPINGDEEWTILVPAIEENRRLIPADAPQTATARRAEILIDEGRRRQILGDDQ